MELKVWVDGIKRVVCGVTDHTTCQDIVIALAQAMGRTGRFTLIEQWRENKRPLAPNECPLLVLQKWGEFANEVKLILYESGSKQKQKMVENDQTVKKTQDRFTHNFTPPVKTSEAVIRRSLTFSGSRKPDANYMRRDERANQGYGQALLPNKTLAPPQKVMSDGTSWSSSSSISSQNSSVIPPQHQHLRQPRSSSQERHSVPEQRRRPSPQPNPLQHSNQGMIPQHLPNHKPTYTASQNHPNHIRKNNSPQPNYTHNSRQPYNNYDKQTDSVAVMNGPIHHSAFSPVLPHRNNQDELDMGRFQNSDIPVYTQPRKSSQPHVEEYDLDSNFPDVVKETGHEFLVEEYHVPGSNRSPGQGQAGHHGNQASWEEQERVKLLRLVTMQNERIKMQDSQLDIIDTEISSREQKLEDLKIELDTVLNEISELSKDDREINEELEALDNGKLIEEMEREKQNEKEIKAELNSLQSRLEKCEKDLHQFKTKVKICNKDLEREQDMQKNDEKRRKEEEVRLQSEILELKKNLDERSKELEGKTKTAEVVQGDLNKVNEQLSDRTSELTNIEKELQKENLKFFQEPKSPEKSSKSQETNGEAVIKVLEGGVSPNLSRKLAHNHLTILSAVKGKNGVWV